MAIWWDKYLKRFGVNPYTVKCTVFLLTTVMQLRQYLPQVIGVKGAPLVVY